MKSLDLLCAELHSLIESTEEIFGSVDRDDVEQLPELIGRREQHLEDVVRVAEDLNSSPDTRHELVLAMPQLKSLISSIQAQDTKLVDVFGKKKDALWERLQQAQNEKRLSVYSR